MARLHGRLLKGSRGLWLGLVVSAAVGWGFSAGCAGRQWDAPASWQPVAGDLSNLRGTYSNLPADRSPDVLWDRIAPDSRKAHWTMPHDCVAIEALDRGNLRFRLIRDGNILDELTTRCDRSWRYVALPDNSRAEEDTPLATTRTQRVWLSVDAEGNLCVRVFVHRHGLFGEDGWTRGGLMPFARRNRPARR
jgi:hypothetical protein